MIGVAESMPDARVALVQDIGEYITSAIMAEVKDRLAEVVLAHGTLATREGRAAASALIEGAARTATANIVNRLAASPDARPHLTLVQ